MASDDSFCLEIQEPLPREVFMQTNSKEDEQHRGQGTKEVLKKRKAHYQKILRELTMMSDMFLRNVLKDRDCAQEVLKIIFEEKNLELVEAETQQDYKNLHGRSLELDCVALTRDGRIFDIEVEGKSSRADPKRARYHSGLLDMNILNPGEDFDNLPEMYTIFIVNGDVLKEGKIIYHIDRTIRESGRMFGDQSHVIYINAAFEKLLETTEEELAAEETALCRLIHDFHCKNADEMHNKILAKRVRELKETKKGVKRMCKEMDKIYQWGEREGERRGKRKNQKESTLRMGRKGYKEEEIAEILNVSKGLVRKWLSEERGLMKA